MSALFNILSESAHKQAIGADQCYIIVCISNLLQLGNHAFLETFWPHPVLIDAVNKMLPLLPGGITVIFKFLFFFD